MPQVKRDPLQFGNVQASGHEELAGASPSAINVIVDATGAVHRRPGLTYRSPLESGLAPWVSLGSPIVALHSTAKGRLFAVEQPVGSQAHIFELAGPNVYDLSINPEAVLLGDRRATIAETEAMLVFAAGAEPQKVLLKMPAPSSRLGGGPPFGSHIVAHKSRLLLNDVRTANTNTIRYSGTASGSSIAGHENWTPEVDDPNSPSFFLAEARPDPVVALHENTNELFAFGTTNLQIYTAAESGAFTFLAANTREFGCSSPYSVVKYDQSFGFVDQYRRVVVTDGRDFQVISHDIQQTLDDIPSFGEAFGYRVTLGPVDALCWGSPRDGRTFAYQISSKSWSVWHSWNGATNNFRFWPVYCSVRIPETSQMLVGVNAELYPDRDPIGDVCALSNAVYADVTTQTPETLLTSKIVARVDTGFMDRGTSGRKLCRAARLTWRGTPSTDTAAFLQWRDDGGPWEDPRQVEIGHNSETILRALGVYRRRQWRVTFSGSNQLVLARAEEEYELLAV